jgi:SNF2 family DNA or RNA helicase
MGLGKTVQLLAHIATEKAAKKQHPFLVIAPTSLMSNWKSEAKRFVPDLKVLTLHGSARKVHFKDIKEYDLVLTTYPLLLRDKDILIAHEYHTIILDEAQTIKNAKAKITQIVNQLKASHRLCMTGTPIENHLGELWSLFHFLLPGYLGTYKQFNSLFRTPIEKARDVKRSEALSRRIKPFVLRRTKQEVVTELPPKTEIVRMVELEGEQRDLYETIRSSMHEKIQEAIAAKGVEKSHIIILDALLKLRQACCDPALLKIATPINQSAKRNELMTMLTTMTGEGRKILLFSQFTSMLALIEKQLDKDNIPYVILTGQTKDRETPVRRFQEGEVLLFLISLKAGGMGLNLTAADTVIHYDPWWNPAVENQATDRAYRIGQDKPVFVYKLITSGTVEEKIIEMQAKKRQLMDNLFDPAAKASVRLTAKDIQSLFEPLI